MARRYETRDWQKTIAPTCYEIRLLALESYGLMPQDFRDLVGEIVFAVEDIPNEDIMDSLALETPYDLLGLFEGTGSAQKWTPQGNEGANRLTLYRRAILDSWLDSEETLGEIIMQILIHELGMHFGMSDEEIYKLGDALT